MKKNDAVDKLDRLGDKISGLHASAWNTALNPTQYGWANSIFSAATIPILSAASIGQLVGSAVVKQINPDIIERLTEFPDDKTKGEPKP
jgi:hypothetical protein